MARNKYGILFIDIPEEFASEDGRIITLEESIENHLDGLTEFIKNPNTSKLIYLKTPQISGFPIRLQNSFILVCMSGDGTELNVSYELDVVIGEKATINYKVI